MIAHVNYKQVSWQDLTLALFDRSLDRNEFQIIEHASVPDANEKTASLYFAVIGASHLVEFKHGEHYFTEVFSCQNNFHQNPVRTIRLGTSNPMDKMNWNLKNSALDYKVRLEHYRQSSVTLSFLHDFLQPCMKKIWVDFPPGEYDGIPFTAIGAGYNNEGVFIRSIHGYNHEQKIILSNSTITICDL